MDAKKSSTCLTFLSCLLLAFVCFLRVEAACKDEVSVSERIVCAASGVTPAECEKKGCCFDSSIPGVPWCFFTDLEPQACKDLVEVSDRVSCGWNGITPKECEDRECCFDASISGVPWCFSIPEPPEPKTEMKTQPPPEPRACKDLVEVSDRVSCGWGGITQKECEDRECCFDSSIRDVPWCFSIPEQPQACKDLVEVSDRVSCGWGGITQKECEDRECCFDSSIRDVPWCFSIPEPPEPKTEMKTQPPPEVTTIPTTLACELPSGLKNVAVGKEADQSSINKGAGADRAVDGNKNSDLKKGKSCMWTKKEFEPWWKVDLGQEYSIYEVVITNRQDCCPFRIKNAVVRIGSNANVENNPVCGHQVLGKRSRQETITVRCGCKTPMRGRYVSIKLADKTQVLHVCEVEVMAL